MMNNKILVPLESGGEIGVSRTTYCPSCGGIWSSDHVCQTGDKWKEATLREINAKLDRVLAALDTAEVRR